MLNYFTDGKLLWTRTLISVPTELPGRFYYKGNGMWCFIIFRALNANAVSRRKPLKSTWTSLLCYCTSYFLSSAGKCLPSVPVAVHIAIGARGKTCILGRSFVNLAWGLFSKMLLWTICHWHQVWQTSPFRLIQIKIRNASLELGMKYRLQRHHFYLWHPKTTLK